MKTLEIQHKFELPADDWFHIAPLGEFDHASGVRQVIDEKACQAMAANFGKDAEAENFPGLLVDFDHFSHAPDKASAAAGWITALRAEDCQLPIAKCQLGNGQDHTPEGRRRFGDRRSPLQQDSGSAGASPSSESGALGNQLEIGNSKLEMPRRAPGLWAQIRWSDLGEAAVRGGRYRLVSPVWNRADCEVVTSDALENETKKEKVRPLRLSRLALTNDPNLKGLVPLTNRQREQRDAAPSFPHPDPLPEGEGDGAMQSRPTTQTTARQEPLSPENGGTSSATQEEGNEMSYKTKLVELLGLKADAGDEEIDAAIATSRREQESLQQRYGALLASRVEDDLHEFAAVIDNVETVRGQLLANREGTLEVLRALKSPHPDGGQRDAGLHLPSPQPSPRGRGGQDVGAMQSRPTTQTVQPLHNRATAKVPEAVFSTERKPGEEARARRIANRAREIQKQLGVGHTQAFEMAKGEVEKA